MRPTPLQRLHEHGQSPWLDALSRGLVRCGGLERLVRGHGIRGAAWHPADLRRAIEAGDDYDEEIRALTWAGEAPDAIVRALAVRDAREACDALAPVWEASGGADGHVSLGIDPLSTRRAGSALAAARRLRELVGRPNLLVGIPATPGGIGAIEDAIAAGIPVDATLIVSPARHGDVLHAYVRGVERLVQAGGDPSRVSSVASIRMAEVDAEVDRRLAAIGGPAASLRGRLAVANGLLAHRRACEVFGTARWERLQARGARRQRCLWAGTAPAGAASGDTRYVEALVCSGTVVAMPPQTLVAFEHHGRVAAARSGDAAGVLDDVASAGVDLDDVWGTLEERGLRQALDGMERLLATLLTSEHRRRARLARVQTLSRVRSARA